MTEPENGRRIILPGEPEPGPEVRWDKDAPTGPPIPQERQFPEWFTPVYVWLKQIVQDESLVADLCLERAIDIVEFNHARGMVGIDYFAEGGGTPARTSTVAMAVPLAVELYRQTAASIAKREAELEKVVKDARANSTAA